MLEDENCLYFSVSSKQHGQRLVSIPPLKTTQVRDQLAKQPFYLIAAHFKDKEQALKRAPDLPVVELARPTGGEPPTTNTGGLRAIPRWLPTAESDLPIVVRCGAGSCAPPGGAAEPNTVGYRSHACAKATARRHGEGVGGGTKRATHSPRDTKTPASGVKLPACNRGETMVHWARRCADCASFRGFLCGKTARRDLRGWHPATGVPTPIAEE
ncbi:hypothetical protein BH23VER1_BH23VER1_10360 [soil metagenome]